MTAAIEDAMKHQRDIKSDRGILRAIRQFVERGRNADVFARRPSTNPVEDDSHLEYSMRPRKKQAFGKRAV